MQLPWRQSIRWPKTPAAVHPDGVVNSSWNGGTGIWDVKVDWT
jgi:hypothetical protein